MPKKQKKSTYKKRTKGKIKANRKAFKQMLLKIKKKLKQISTLF